MPESILEQLKHEAPPRVPAAGPSILRQLEKPAVRLTTGQKIVRGSAGSMIGGALGGVLGTVAMPGPGSVAGTMIGSAAGEAITQYVDPFGSGVDKPSLLQIALAGILPTAPALARRFFTSLPGAAAGAQQFLLKSLGDKGQRVIAQVAPVAGTADALFRQARASGAQVAVPLTATITATQTASNELAKSKFATGSARALIRQAQAFIQRGPVTFDDFRINQTDLGATVRALGRKGGPALGRAKQLYAATWDDLDAALAQPSAGSTGTLLRQAIDAYKREEAAKFLKEFFLASRVRRVGQLNFDADAFLQRIDRHRDVLARLLSNDEIDDVIKLMTHARLGRPGIAAVKIPVMAKTPQLGFETMPFAARAVVGGSIGGIAEMAGGGSGAMGLMGGVLAVEALSTALTTWPGRFIVRNMLQHGLTWDHISTLLLQGGRTALRPGDQVRIDNPNLIKELMK